MRPRRPDGVVLAADVTQYLGQRRGGLAGLEPFVEAQVVGVLGERDEVSYFRISAFNSRKNAEEAASRLKAINW